MCHVLNISADSGKIITRLPYHDHDQWQSGQMPMDGHH